MRGVTTRTRLYSKRQILTAMEKAGVKVSDDLMDNIWKALAPDALAGLTEPTPTKAITTAWTQGVSKPVSKAGIGALEDVIKAKHRPGGRLAPRPRWSDDSTDEDNPFLRTKAKEATRTPVNDDDENADPITKIMTAMANPGPRTKAAPSKTAARPKPAKAPAPIIQDDRVDAIMAAMRKAKWR